MKTKISIPAYFSVLILIVFTQLPFTTFSQDINFGKSYINVTKGLNGGTVEPGDVLEIRASVVVRSGTYDSCAYFDVVPTGTTYIASTVRVLTNEGKIYKQFTDAAGDDEGSITGSNIRINLGYNQTSAPATRFRRGRIANTHRPSFYNSTCIMIASFRVTVTAAYNTTVSIGGGSMSYKLSTGSLSTFTFPSRTVAIYQNVGICPNAIGTNALGTEFNGTFGSGKPRNRGASANVPTGYTYNVFAANSPQDYYYGIPNNTSIRTGYTTLNTWPKPDNTRRVFGVWDIIGDHTGAADPLLGNPASDTVANNNGGYMLVINAAYRIDSAFQQTISGLCPNTYYEISLWVRNICSRCACDSAGRGAGSTGFIPTALGDSSGVYPNLSFNVNNIDYYTTGNVLYTGNWIKKGFTILTGSTQTSFTLKVFNNAPGGGGNDWALDDITVATCSPNLAFTPNDNPTVCEGNVVDLGAYIRSYFNNYTYYKWQRSTDNGSTWADASMIGAGSPTWNGSAWEYYTSYPTFVANSSDSGLKFRVVVASTISNITDPNCSFADAASILTLNVIDCGTSLTTNIISFAGKIENNSVKLNWTTNKEDEPIKFDVQRSSDGRNFSPVATINGLNNNAEINYYNWSEPYVEGQTFLYRVKLIGASQQKLSGIVKLFAGSEVLSIENIPNPFTDKLIADIYSPTFKIVHLTLIDNAGRYVYKQQFTLSEGQNQIQLKTGHLAKGAYTLQMQSDTSTIYKKVLKQ